ncbi:methyltransferase domain-containing protein [Acidaminobacter sp. JC074]|uniref:class I SAM-dependent methyltransferase n=1 Tax=Acidaminobacter sp. JC074 TaxID=2530199 RepID=UPI001F0E1D3B|nr:class I SAM-dependent methyltransferase [Acidaminobacter sp. JC074]MCH4889289.1 methyltransferase domain-containing protein [Acidaminobacter sp. JC074]
MEKNCLICHSNNFQLVKETLRDSDKQSVYICNNCNHIQLHPIYTDDEAKDFYSNNKQAKTIYKIIDMDLIEKKATADTKRRLELLKKEFHQKSSIFEIGSGYGTFINEALANQFNVVGCELGDDRRKIAKERYNVDLLDIDITHPDMVQHLSKYDGILLFHVLEHIIDLDKFVNSLKFITHNKSKIIIEVPNADDLLVKSCKEYSDFYYQSAHVSYFTKDILIDYFENRGFRLISASGIQRYSIENTFNWLINKQPQITNTSFNLCNEYQWLESYFKSYLTDNFISDTIILIFEVE